MLGQPKRVILVLSLAALSWTSAVLAEPADFPRPKELEPAVRFWKRVYTQVDTQGGLIHDEKHLEVVYEVVRFPDDVERRARRKLVNAAKERYRNILLRLAKGKREGLDEEETRVLALWPEGTSDSSLRAAASRLRFQLGQSDRFREGLARSGIWEKHIREILAEMGLPEELVALPHVESSFNPNARSHIGAAGLWQFTRSTGRRYLRIDSRVDERMDPYLSTVAAAKLLSHDYAATGAWPLAVTSYNHGTAGVRRAVSELNTTDIARIVREYEGGRFGFASRNFYVAFLAAVDIHSDPAKYFGDVPRHAAAPTQLVEVPEEVRIATLRRALGIDEDVLRKNNPALRAPVWRGASSVPRGFELRVPASAPREDLLAALSRIKEEKPVAPARPERPEPAVMAENGQYTVQRGDSVWLIARRLGMKERTLIALNDLEDGSQIHAGQVLRVEPGAAGKAPSKAESDADQSSSRKASRELVDDLIAATGPAEPASAEEADEIAPAALSAVQPDLVADPSDYSVSKDGSIEVQATETLGHYAEWLGLSAAQLRRANGMPFGQPVVVGKRLKLDFSKVPSAQFESRRIAYHRGLQEAFFRRYRIAGSGTHVVREGESIWVLARRKFAVPMWLLRQYNPDMDFSALAVGASVTVPRLESRDQGALPLDRGVTG